MERAGGVMTKVRKWCGPGDVTLPVAVALTLILGFRGPAVIVASLVVWTLILVTAVVISQKAPAIAAALREWEWHHWIGATWYAACVGALLTVLARLFYYDMWLGVNG